jgi:hypothetical protein
VYDLLQKGELRAIKIGRLTRISRAAVEEFIARSESRSPNSAWDERHLVDRRSAVSDAPVHNGKISQGRKRGAGDGRTVQQYLLDADASSVNAVGRSANAEDQTDPTLRPDGDERRRLVSNRQAPGS